MWVAVVFVAALVALQVLGWRAMARKDFRRAGGAGLAALGEIVQPHAAEHQRVEEHAADVDEDDDGDGDGDGDGPGRGRRPQGWRGAGERGSI